MRVPGRTPSWVARSFSGFAVSVRRAEQRRLVGSAPLDVFHFEDRRAQQPRAVSIEVVTRRPTATAESEMDMMCERIITTKDERTGLNIGMHEAKFKRIPATSTK